MQLDGLFVDMYGTLTGGDRAAVEAVCQRVVRDAGLGMNAVELSITWGELFLRALEHTNGHRFETLTAIEGRTLRETMADMNIDIDPEPYVADLVRYWRSPPLQPEAAEFLERCPWPVCIVSNADREDLETALAHHGIEVAGVVTSQDARSYKPHPEIFVRALQHMGWSPGRVLHVGDSLYSDIEGARNAGLRSVWIKRSVRIHDIGRHQPDYASADLLGLLDVLANS